MLDPRLQAAQSADVVVLALGGICHEGEGTDRNSLGLPGAQEQLFEAMLKLSPGVKIAVVIINGGPISIDAIKTSPVAVVLHDLNLILILNSVF